MTEDTSRHSLTKNLSYIFKKGLVTCLRFGEFGKFSVHGRPDPSSTILLVGSGRSGTTWLMDVIASEPGVQSIFEPLNPIWSAQIRQLTGWDTARLRPRSYYLRPNGNYPDWDTFLGRVLRGQERSIWTDVERNSYFPSKFLIKLIRGNMMVGYLLNKFQPRIIYMRRHPCATIVSRLELGWQADVDDILSQEELVEDYLQPWISDIEKERDLIGAHAVWWSIENMVAEIELKDKPHYPLNYENLCISPHKHVRSLFDWLDFEYSDRTHSIVEKPSRQSRNGIMYRSTMERLSYWKNKLTTEDVQRVLNWVHRLGIVQYTNQLLPVSIENEIA